MFELNEQQQMFQSVIRSFCDKELAPLVEDMDECKILPFDLCRRMMTVLGIKDIMRMAFEKKAEALEKGKEEGKGSDSLRMSSDDPLMGSILLKELCRYAPGFALSWGASIGLCGNAINVKGNADQLRKYGVPVATFDKIGAWGLTEPGAGSDAFGSMKTVAKPNGDVYILKGSKTFITNAPFADIFVIYAKIDRGQPKAQQPVHSFILERGMPGLTTGKPFKKMGMRDSPTGEIFIEDVHVPKENLLGTEKDNIRDVARESLGSERSSMPAMALGIIERCYELSLKYSRERVQFGKPISEFQAIQLKLANMYIMQENVRNTVYRLAWMAANRKKDFAFTCASKAYCSGAAVTVALDAISIHGGYGYMTEYHVEKLMRDAKLLEIGAGTTDINLLQTARLELGS
jgi:alkylation response protein AidB-like acyl-CoA dehydrogenase